MLWSFGSTLELPNKKVRKDIQTARPMGTCTIKTLGCFSGAQDSRLNIEEPMCHWYDLRSYPRSYRSLMKGFHCNNLMICSFSQLQSQEKNNIFQIDMKHLAL